MNLKNIAPFVYGNNGTCELSSSLNSQYNQHGFCTSEYTCTDSHIIMMDIICVFFSACMVAKYVMHLGWDAIVKTIMLFIGILYLGLLFSGVCLFLMHFLIWQNMSLYDEYPLKEYEIYIFSSAKYSCESAQCRFGNGRGGVYIIANMMFLLYFAFISTLYIIRVSWHDLGKISTFLMRLMIIRQIIGSLYSITNTCLYISYGMVII